MKTPLPLRERLEGGLVGLLVGDALGVPYEFHGPGAIPATARIEMTPPDGYARAHEEVPPGTWSDDGAQALCLLASLLHCGRLDPDDLGRRLVRWLDHGYLTADGRVFDVGIQTARVLNRVRDGAPGTDAGETDERSNGNGALMRVLPLALWHAGSDRELVADAMAQSRVTHAHARSQLACALYCLWARRTLEATPDPWGDALYTLMGLARRDAEAMHELAVHVAPSRAPRPTGSGYVADTLLSARHACEERTYENVVRAAVALGDDTDTTACVAGGIAGLREGVTGIPARWREALRGRDVVQPLLDGLLVHRGAG